MDAHVEPVELENVSYHKYGRYWILVGVGPRSRHWIAAAKTKPFKDICLPREDGVSFQAVYDDKQNGQNKGGRWKAIEKVKELIEEWKDRRAALKLMGHHQKVTSSRQSTTSRS